MKNKRLLIILSIILFISNIVLLPMQANAVTKYPYNSTAYDEGYIVIGESHVASCSHACRRLTDESGKLKGVNNVYFSLIIDDSISVDENNNPNTFIMDGNLFFVFEGRRPEDGTTQYSKEFIYSDGNGNRGKGVSKIHEIMKNHPNIKHWTIISYHGARSEIDGYDVADYYINSYNNWINYEFPNADFYILSHSIMTKVYKSYPSAAYFEKTLKETYPDRYLDYTDFYMARYPDRLLDPSQKTDQYHWAPDVYGELMVSVLNEIKKKK